MAVSPKLLLKVNGSAVFTRDYQKGFIFRRTIKAGTSGIITNVHTGIFGGITNIDVRLKNGEFLREVPVDYFRA